ncbi:MAG: glycosyltransferase [Candidatus Omnitrophica bacterium]|nr:glycosyltransferase [Candidatus Omnitrophota bacterium]MCB9746858.1 glycosyltransferase [Candidatus Omnitrophota bacterium]
MKILQILPELNYGGVETGTIDFAQYLVQHGHDSYVVSNGGQQVILLEKNGSKHITLPVHQKSLWTILKMIKVLRKIILDEQIEIVHARSRVPAWIAYFACKQTPAVFVTTCHGHYQSRLFSQVMGWGKYVIVPSAAIGRHMVETFKVPHERIRCIARSVNLKRFKFKNEVQKKKDKYTVVIVGRITPLKGHNYFIKAMAKVIRNMPNVQVKIIGDAPKRKEEYRKELELLAKRLGLKEHIEFMGNRSDVAQLLENVDCLVLATVTQEAFGRVILEAQAIGVPVVATQVGGVVDIIDDEQTGLLVLPKDIDAMADQVMRILRNREFATTLVQNARHKVEQKFTVEQMAEQTLAVYQEMQDKLDICVVKLSSVGDVVLVTASLKALRKKYPKAKIYFLVGRESYKVIQHCPYIDEIIIFDFKGKEKGTLGFIRRVFRLRRYQFDIMIDFQNNRLSHWLIYLSSPIKSYGYDNGKWGNLLTNSITDKGEPLNPVEHQFQVLKELGISYKGHHFLELWPTKKDQEYAHDLLSGEWIGEQQRIVGINVAASAKWETKNWPIENIAKICDLFSAENIRVVLTGMQKDKTAAAQIIHMTKSKPADLTGRTDMMQLAAVIKMCKVYITADSAPMHVAAAMRTPFIAFFGPTSSQRHLPPAKKCNVLEKTMDCAPCYSSRCKIATHACMKEISVQEVYESALDLLEDNS